MSCVTVGTLTFLFHILLFDFPLIENFDSHLMLCKDMLCNLHLHAARQVSESFQLHRQKEKVLSMTDQLGLQDLPFRMTHYPRSCQGGNLPGRRQGSGACSELLTVPH